MADALDTDIPAVPEGGVVMPGNVTRDQFATEPQIQAAVGQLNAGQPVTALPIQEWSLDQQRAWNDKLTQYDRQAAATKLAAEQAARDAAMLDQMSRVAKSTKDIEVAMQQVDIHRFQSDLANGVPAWQAAQRSPRVLTSPLVSMINAQVQPRFVPPSGQEPAHYVTRAGGISYPPESSMGGTGIGPEMDVANDPESGERIGLWTRRGKNSWQLVLDPKEKALTGGNQITRLSALQRALAYELNTAEAIGALEDPKDPLHQQYLDRRNKLRSVADQLDAMGKTPSKAAPASTNVAPRNAVRDPKTGKWKLQP